MKKILTITGFAALAATLFFNASLSKENSLHGISLASLTTVNQANAECIASTGSTVLFGRCVADWCYMTDMWDSSADCEY